MRIMAISTLRQFWEIHADAEEPIGYVRFIGTHTECDRINAEEV